ncbi:unnamed protein product [Paramecium sonneborni]|uniref:Uncharacterized protein n=1 Tax=Paramecium sonneborni TaxID=65129 RepID=A0A8S1REK3_9CILI|nr:unnamed protein product [Paramecium sonneborni]
MNHHQKLSNQNKRHVIINKLNIYDFHINQMNSNNIQIQLLNKLLHLNQQINKMSLKNKSHQTKNRFHLILLYYKQFQFCTQNIMTIQYMFFHRNTINETWIRNI